MVLACMARHLDRDPGPEGWKDPWPVVTNEKKEPEKPTIHGGTF
jgi:hypothetical protein